MRSVAGLLTLLFLAVAPTLGSQPVRGIVRGTVTDEAGDRVPGAAVTVINEATRTERHAATRKDGKFLIVALPAGRYSIRVELEGFRTYSVTGVRVATGASVRVKVALSAAVVEETTETRSPAVPLSTFSIDVDTASYAGMRRFIRLGSLPPKDAVRIEELINHFSYDYPPPSNEAPFSITSELGECPWQAGHKLLLVGLQGREIDTDLEAHKVPVGQATGTLVTIAKDVRIQVEFNLDRVAAYRLIGYENQMLRDEDFEDDLQETGKIGAAHSVTALYEIVPVGEDRLSKTAASPELATVTLRYKSPEAEQSRHMSLTVEDATREGTLPANLGFAAAVAELGMILRDSGHRGAASHAQVLELARRHRGEDSEGHRAEFIQLVEQAKQLR